jgi:hypothetical protein
MSHIIDIYFISRRYKKNNQFDKRSIIILIINSAAITEDMEESSVFDRYYNPFDVKWKFQAI